MLVELWIRNVALIEEARVSLGPGLTVLTGETGAGKSLLVGALDLALGARAAADLVRRGAEEAEVAARFAPPPGWADEEEDLGGEDEIVLRRVIGRDGRSRAYVNDRPATVGRLRAIGSRLADLHGQHEQQTLLREETHLDYLDAFGDLAEARGIVAESHRAYVAATQARDALLAETRRVEEERALLAFQHRELLDADLRGGEEEELLRERKRAAHAGRLAESAGHALDALNEDADSAEARLGRAARALEDASSLDESLAPIRRQVDEALLAVEDAARELARYLDRLDADPERLAALETRLDRLAALRRKYRMSEAELIARRDELTRLLDAAADLPAVMEAHERAVAAAGDRLVDAAGRLSRERERAATRLARAVTRELSGLGMAEARFHAALVPSALGATVAGHSGRYAAHGAETASFRLAANPGEPSAALAAAASGGEVSRVMLALKTVLRRADPVPLAVFDEVDAGIGGVVAEQVGARLRAIASERQVLVVTHLPVIAGRADRHLHIAKATVRGRTTVAIRPLNPAEREEEIARMLAGRSGGEHARRTARELLAPSPGEEGS